MTDFLLIIIVALSGLVSWFGKKTLDRIEKKISSVESDLKPITPAIVEIQGKFKDAGHTLLFPLTVTPGSPLKLTEYGEKLMKESGFCEVLKKNRKELVDGVKVKSPKTNYDIQQFSKQLIHELFENDNEMFRPLKDYAFNNGMNVKILVPPAGLLLRDEVMKELKFK
jgi:hypothetical protein